MNLIRGMSHLTRLEFPDVLFNMGEGLREWLKTQSEDFQKAFFEHGEGSDPRAVRVEVLGAMDETAPYFQQLLRDIAKMQAFFDQEVTNCPADELVREFMMFKLGLMWIKGLWLLDTYKEGLAKGIVGRRLQRYVNVMHREKYE